jgi:hypothetical protein
VKTDRRETAEIYQGLVNYAAFVDKAVVDVWGTRRVRAGDGFVQRRNLAIGGHGRFYARAIRGRSGASGNGLQVAYGVMRPFGHVAPFKWTFWAGRRPVMCSDTLVVLDSFFRSAYRARVSRVELTFDVEGISQSELAWSLCTRARSLDEVDSGYGRTLYVGSVRAEWQAKIYQRTYSVVRIEFMLRSSFLRKTGINRPHDLYRLCRAPVFDLLSFKRIDRSSAESLPPRLKRFWKALGHGVPPIDIPPSFIQKTCREDGVNPDPWVVPSSYQKLLRRMQRQLVW